MDIPLELGNLKRYSELCSVKKETIWMLLKFGQKNVSEQKKGQTVENISWFRCRASELYSVRSVQEVILFILLVYLFTWNLPFLRNSIIIGVKHLMRHSYQWLHLQNVREKKNSTTEDAQKNRPNCYWLDLYMGLFSRCNIHLHALFVTKSLSQPKKSILSV